MGEPDLLVQTTWTKHSMADCALFPHQSWHPWAGHYLRKAFLMSKPRQLPGGLLCCCSWVSVKLFFINTARVSNSNCRVLECLREWGQRGVMRGGAVLQCYRIIHVQLIKIQTDLNMMEFDVSSILLEERRKKMWSVSANCFLVQRMATCLFSDFEESLQTRICFWGRSKRTLTPRSQCHYTFPLFPECFLAHSEPA